MVDACRNTLERTLRRIAEERGFQDCAVEITPTSSGGANYTSQIFLGTISAPDKEDLKVFGKVATLGADVRSMMPSNIYHKEQYVYTTLAAIFEKIQEKFEITPKDRLVLPTMYGYDATVPDEVIVLEDLGARGYAMLDRLQTFDWQYAAAAAQQLARLHALSIATQHYHPKEYQEIEDNLKIDEATFQLSFAVTIMEQSVMKYIDLIKEENRELVRKFMANKYSKLINGLTKIRCQKVIAHGDFRASNIMHKIDDDGKIQMVVLDYQTMVVGTPVTDLLYLIFTGSDAEFRRRNFESLLDHYYDQLELALSRLQLQASKILPRHEFDREINQHFAIGLVNAFCVMPLLTVDVEDAPDEDESLNLDTLLDVKTSQLCTQRLNEIVEDYIKWGIL